MEQVLECSHKKIPKYLDWAQWLMVAGTFFYNRVEIVLIAIAFLLVLRKNGRLLKSRILKYMIIVYGISAITIAWCGYTYGKFLQQIFIISLMFLMAEQIFLHNKCYIQEIFRKFIKFSYYASLLGILQEVIWIGAHYDISSILDMQWITHFPGMHVENGPFLRARAMCLEGGGLGPFLVPALIYLLYYKDCYKIINSKWKTGIVVACAMFTLSPVPYLALGVIAYLRIVKVFPRLKLVFWGLGIVGCIYGYIELQKSELSSATDIGGFDGIIVRLRDTTDNIQHLDSQEAALEGNLSTVVLMTNLYSAINAPSRILGSGIGTNSQNYNQIYGGYKYSEYSGATSLNNDDAYCLGIRLFSETGIVGFLMFLFFLYRYFRKDIPINVCIMFVLIPYIAKGGTYFGGGIQFYLLMAYYSSKLIPRTGNKNGAIEKYNNSQRLC